MDPRLHPARIRFAYPLAGHAPVHAQRQVGGSVQEPSRTRTSRRSTAQSGKHTVKWTGGSDARATPKGAIFPSTIRNPFRLPSSSRSGQPDDNALSHFFSVVAPLPQVAVYGTPGVRPRVWNVRPRFDAGLEVRCDQRFGRPSRRTLRDVSADAGHEGPPEGEFDEPHRCIQPQRTGRHRQSIEVQHPAVSLRTAPKPVDRSPVSLIVAYVALTAADAAKYMGDHDRAESAVRSRVASDACSRSGPRARRHRSQRLRRLCGRPRRGRIGSIRPQRSQRAFAAGTIERSARRAENLESTASTLDRESSQHPSTMYKSHPRPVPPGSAYATRRAPSETVMARCVSSSSTARDATESGAASHAVER